jgi:hypothetical protein
MKTTVEISDTLFREARQYAHAHDITFREVVEAGLRNLVSAGNASNEPFRLENRSFRGDGMVRDYSWPEIRSITYEGRGE